jgi:hypothetical protein
MKLQHRSTLEASTPATLSLTRLEHDGSTPRLKGDTLTRSVAKIGNVTYVLLMITIVCAHPIWAMWLLVFVYS